MRCGVWRLRAVVATGGVVAANATEGLEKARGGGRRVCVRYRR